MAPGPRPGSAPLLHADVYRLDHLAEVADLGLGRAGGGRRGGPGRVGGRGRARARRRRPGRRASTAGPRRRGAARRSPSAADGPAWAGPVGRHWSAPWPGGGLAGVTLLAIESATDLVGVGPAPARRRRRPSGSTSGGGPTPSCWPRPSRRCARVSGCTLADVDAMAVDVGPGLFTGLRVGVATAKALGQALGLGVLGVTSLDVLAAARPGRAGRARRRARHRGRSVVDARRGEVFAAAYRFGRRRARAGPAPDGDPADRCADDRPEPLAPDVARGVAGRGGRPTGRVAGGGRRCRPLPPPARRPRPGLDLGLAHELASPPPLALARLARPRLAAGRCRRRRRPGARLPPAGRRPDQLGAAGPAAAGAGDGRPTRTVTIRPRCTGGDPTGRSTVVIAPMRSRGPARRCCGSRRRSSRSPGRIGCSSRSSPSARPASYRAAWVGASSSATPARCSSTTSPT